ncbi:MAG: aminotransferase class I/II-fold pyridoxal phosphate-dependent enzyme [Candidatus Thermoplasmatota archaeon]|nr:aminotransferase class I/II-fold pyridoxal phosphate-dependent enzyme [Candidatus Thermoplasmatota archaeon]
MQAPHIDLFEWLEKNAPLAKYNLAFSNIQGLTMGEYQKLAGFCLPPTFDLGVNAPYGSSTLQDTLSDMYQCHPDNIVTTTGATEANYLVFSSLLDPGDEYIMEQPGYPPLWLTADMLGGRRLNWPRTFDHHYQLDVDMLTQLCTKHTRLVVLTNLHNPSGVLTSPVTLKAVADIAQDHGAWVLVDEIYLDGSISPQPSSFGLPNVIVTSSATKVYGLGGLHTGWAIAPSDIAPRLQRMKAHTTGASSYTSEVMAAHIFQTGRSRLLKRFHAQAKTNLAVLKNWMRHHTNLLNWVPPDGGLVCFPKYSMDIPSVDLCKFLFKTKQLLLNPGAFFNAEGCFRLSYGGDTEVFKSALDVLEQGLQEVQVHH